MPPGHIKDRASSTASLPWRPDVSGAAARAAVAVGPAAAVQQCRASAASPRPPQRREPGATPPQPPRCANRRAARLQMRPAVGLASRAAAAPLGTARPRWPGAAAGGERKTLAPRPRRGRRNWALSPGPRRFSSWGHLLQRVSTERDCRCLCRRFFTGERWRGCMHSHTRSRARIQIAERLLILYRHTVRFCSFLLALLSHAVVGDSCCTAAVSMPTVSCGA